MQFKTSDAYGRRRLLILAATGIVGGLYPLMGRTDDHGDDQEGSSDSSSDKTSQSGQTTPVTAVPSTGPTGKIVVIGGGMAGATVAKYLRLWGGTKVQVTLVEPDAAYTSAIMSNLAVTSARTVDSLKFSLAALTTRYGVVRKTASLQSIDPVGKTVKLSDNAVLAYDRLVLAPGVEFDDAYGLTQQDYASTMPHAWRAGAQTTLLQQQVSGMVNGDVFVMTIPKSPYRCPPGPYERACVVADFLKKRKGSACKVVVLDQNATIQAEAGTFTQAFAVTHAGVIDYQSGVTNVQINPTTRAVSYVDKAGVQQQVSARVVNPIPPHRATGSAAGGWMTTAGLANGTNGRWAKVNVLSYESTAVAGIHIIGDASECGLPKAGHVGNQEAKICADAIVRLLSSLQPDPAPVANSACFSPITASTASWLTAVYQYDIKTSTMKVATNGGQIIGGTPTESNAVTSKNFRNMDTWFKTLMGDTFT